MRTSYRAAIDFSGKTLFPVIATLFPVISAFKKPIRSKALCNESAWVCLLNLFSKAPSWLPKKEKLSSVLLCNYGNSVLSNSPLNFKACVASKCAILSKSILNNPIMSKHF